MVIYDVVWYGVVWYSIVCFGMFGYGMRCIAWHSLCSMVCYHVGCDLVQCSALWCVVSYSAWYETILYHIVYLIQIIQYVFSKSVQTRRPTCVKWYTTDSTKEERQ